MLSKKTTALLAALLTLVLFNSARAADSPSVVEGFGCNFQGDNDFDDLDRVNDYYVNQIAKINSPGLNKMGSVLWIPFRGNVAVDFVWINTNITLAEWGEAAMAAEGSPVGQDIDEKWSEVATCSGSGLAASEAIFSTDSEFKDDGEVLIQSFRCNLHPGMTIADTDKAIAAWRPVFKKAVRGTGANSVVFRRTPIVSGNGFDLTYAAVWDDPAAYATTQSAFLSDPDNAKSGQLFAAAHRCE